MKAIDAILFEAALDLAIDAAEAEALDIPTFLRVEIERAAAVAWDVFTGRAPIHKSHAPALATALITQPFTYEASHEAIAHH